MWCFWFLFQTFAGSSQTLDFTSCRWLTLLLCIDQWRSRWPVRPVELSWRRTACWFCVLLTAPGAECPCSGRGSTPPSPPSVELLSTGETPLCSPQHPGFKRFNSSCFTSQPDWLKSELTLRTGLQVLTGGVQVWLSCSGVVGCRSADTWTGTVVLPAAAADVT